MFITMPIKTFKLEGNKLFVNESVIEYDDISKDTHEILESLISKGAYGSALLTLNMFHNVVSINGSDYTQEEYQSYLGECNKLMEEYVIETEAQNFRPLINLNGLEIMENADHIARGKGNKLLIEDFRMNENYDNGSWMKYQQQIENAFEGAKSEMEEDAFLDFCDGIIQMAREYSGSPDENMYESEEHRPTGNSKADEIVLDFEQSNRSIEEYTKALNEISRMEYESNIDKDKYDECIKKIQDAFKDRDREAVTEECEGTQCSDIAEKKDQNVGKLQRPKKTKKIIESILSVPKNHGFKGFRLNEQGIYTRGNYILINEDGKVKAVNKKLLEEVGPYNQAFKVGSKLDILMSELDRALSEGLQSLGYDDEFKKDYCGIEAEDLDDEYTRITIYAELEYSELDKIVEDYLDKVVQKVDKESYFDFETSGRIIANIKLGNKFKEE